MVQLIGMDKLNIVSVSGGKDSTALYLWAIDAFGKDLFKAVFADTGNEHPVTLNYVRNLHIMAGGPEVEWVKADFTAILDRKGLEETDSVFLDMCIAKGRVPSSKAQFCTENLKMAPIRKWLDDIRGDSEVIMHTGIRRGESLKRSKYERTEFLQYYNCFTDRPFIDWTEQQIFDYLKLKGVPPNPLYEAGFTRVGCFPCIHARKSEIARLPDWAWDKLEHWENKIGRTWFSFGTVPLTDSLKLELADLERTYGEESDQVKDFKNRNCPSVKDAREWSKTERGGKQFGLFPVDDTDVPSCMATWGICE